MHKQALFCGVALAVAAIATPTFAQQVDFNGTRENVNPLLPPGSGRCSPPYYTTVEIQPGNISSTGQSNLGSFTSTQSHCIDSPPPTAVHDGEFTYTFAAGDTIIGTYTGQVQSGSAPGIFDSTENLIITGGTGRFFGASGIITDVGTLSFANGAGNFNGALTGTINASATTSSGNYATAYGSATAALGDYATAYGGLSIANADNSTAIGGQAQASGAGASSLGYSSVASGANALAAGSSSSASGVGAVALGDQTQATQLRSTAVGTLAAATGIASSALGHNTQASGLGSTAVGVSAHATDVGATAVGRLANASFAGSTAIGNGAATTAVNQVALGGIGSAVRIGDISASSDAQTGPLGVATIDANGVIGRDTSLYADVATLRSASASMQGSINSLFDLRQMDRKDYEQGIAAAVAMGSAPFPSAPGRVSYVLNGAMYRGQGAIGGSLMARFNSDTPIALGLGFSYGGGKNTAVRAGVAGEF